MTVSITSSLKMGLISGTGVSFSAPVVPALTTDDIYNADNPTQTLTSMFGPMMTGPLIAGVIPKAVDTAELGNSLISEIGTTVKVAGVLNYSHGVLFAELPAPVLGMTMLITDSNTNVLGNIIAGGGSNNVLGFYNGTNWTVMGK